MLDAVKRIDLETTKFVAGRQHPLLRDVSASLGALGSPTLSIVFLTFSFYMVPWLSRRLLAGLMVVWLAVYTTKYLVSRERPEGHMEAGITSSFPSAHSATAFLVAGVLSGYGPTSLLYAIASIVALSRVYLQTHYLSDVVAGSLIGILIAVIV